MHASPMQMSKYFAKKTMTVEEKLEVNEVRLPDLTVCAEEPYGKGGYFFSQATFDENAKTFEDLFQEGAEEILSKQVR